MTEEIFKEVEIFVNKTLALKAGVDTQPILELGANDLTAIGTAQLIQNNFEFSDVSESTYTIYGNKKIEVRKIVQYISAIILFILAYYFFIKNTQKRVVDTYGSFVYSLDEQKAFQELLSKMQSMFGIAFAQLHVFIANVFRFLGNFIPAANIAGEITNKLYEVTYTADQNAFGEWADSLVKSAKSIAGYSVQATTGLGNVVEPTIQVLTAAQALQNLNNFFIFLYKNNFNAIWFKPAEKVVSSLLNFIVYKIIEIHDSGYTLDFLKSINLQLKKKETYKYDDRTWLGTINFFNKVGLPTYTIKEYKCVLRRGTSVQPYDDVNKKIWKEVTVIEKDDIIHEKLTLKEYLLHPYNFLQLSLFSFFTIYNLGNQRNTVLAAFYILGSIQFFNIWIAALTFKTKNIEEYKN